ncbi:MAG TPA: 50S ribosomal protein L29 [Candidatus Paceibacterota bacterium]|nr:50S ribosomal protein L29 [Candidatus Paceibacterota bacterium]
MKDKKNSLKEVKVEDLRKKLHELEEKGRVIKFKAEGSKSKNVKEGMTLRKEIARIMTELNSPLRKEK